MRLDTTSTTYRLLENHKPLYNHVIELSSKAAGYREEPLPSHLSVGSCLIEGKAGVGKSYTRSCAATMHKPLLLEV